MFTNCFIFCVRIVCFIYCLRIVLFYVYGLFSLLFANCFILCLPLWACSIISLGCHNINTVAYLILISVLLSVCILGDIHGINMIMSHLGLGINWLRRRGCEKIALMFIWEGKVLRMLGRLGARWCNFPYLWVSAKNIV